MILIPSAFFSVLFEPITIPLLRFWEDLKDVLKWGGYFILYLVGLVLLVFTAIFIFVMGSTLCQKMGW